MSFTATALEGTKSEQYAQLTQQARALVDGESDRIANAANLSALVFNSVPDVNWVGFYLFDGTELVVGPFQGLPACVRIALGKGVCGTAASSRQTQRVEDVHAFPGHIACDGGDPIRTGGAAVRRGHTRRSIRPGQSPARPLRCRRPGRSRTDRRGLRRIPRLTRVWCDNRASDRRDPAWGMRNCYATPNP